MTTPDELRDQVLDDAFEGSAEIQIGDRRVRKLSPKERLDAIKEIGEQTATENSPFIKVGFKQRGF